MSIELIHTPPPSPAGIESIAAMDGENQVGHVSFREAGGHLEIRSIETLPSHARQGIARRLLAELERIRPGVPIGHGALTRDGLALNTAVYGPALHGELTAILEGDPDAAEFDLGPGEYGDGLYRGGWTLNGQRVTRAEALAASTAGGTTL